MISNKRTLYISDLDGTLLNEQSRISSYTAAILNRLIDKGMLFSIATARTPATVVELMRDVHLALPTVLMTGALTYDIVRNDYLSVSSFSQDIAQRLLDVTSKASVSPMIYYIDDMLLHVAYRSPLSYEQSIFIRQRKGTPYKKYVEVEHIYKAPRQTVMLFFMGRYEELELIYDSIYHIEGHRSYLYHDPIMQGQGYLEVYPLGTSKASAIKQLAADVRADEIVVFGDNRNDIPMFEIAHRSYAMRNAVDEAKSFATDVIDSNVGDGVARFLLSDFNL